MIDLPTLFAVTVFSTAMSGMLLIYAWFLNRHTPALALWAIGYLVGAVGTALIVARGNIDDVWSIDVANALLAVAYGIMWQGARSFDGRSTPLPYVLIGAVVWLLACQVDAFHASLSARIVLMSSIIMTYVLLTIFEFWRSGERHLTSRWPLIVILGIHAGVFLARVLWPGWLLLLMVGQKPALSVVVLVYFEVLFHTFCAAFLLASMAKERMEHRYKRASLIDPLTGVLNRGGFVDNGTRLLRRMAINRQTAALVAFDLDRFKTINDSYGHPVGDRVLCKFCDVVTEALRPGDLFGRIGGEEFACLLANAFPTDAVAIAERIRSRFAKADIAAISGNFRATVSAGVAVAAQHDWNLAALMLAADQALYRAKESGRNRIESPLPERGTPGEISAGKVAVAKAG